MEKKKESKKFNKLSLKELQEALFELEKDLAEMLKKKMLGKLKNRYEMVRVRKQIARAKTFVTIKKVIGEEEKQSIKSENRN